MLYLFPTPLPYHTEVNLCYNIALALSLYFLVVYLYYTGERHCAVTKMCDLRNDLVGVREKKSGMDAPNHIGLDKVTNA